MRAPWPICALGGTLALGAALSCDKRQPSEGSVPESAAATPDRLGAGESLPESETAFGLPIPPGMRLTRHFDDTAYFSGELSVASVLEHVQRHVKTRDMETRNERVVISRATVTGAPTRHLLRIEISKSPHGSQLHVKNITPPPPIDSLPEAAAWQRAGRNPDGTLLDPNKVY